MYPGDDEVTFAGRIYGNVRVAGTFARQVAPATISSAAAEQVPGIAAQDSESNPTLTENILAGVKEFFGPLIGRW